MEHIIYLLATFQIALCIAIIFMVHLIVKEFKELMKDIRGENDGRK